MEREQWTKYLEVSTNVAVLVVAIVLLGAFVSTRWWPQTGNRKFDSGLQRDQGSRPIAVNRLWRSAANSLTGPQHPMPLLPSEFAFLPRSFKRGAEGRKTDADGGSFSKSEA